MVSIADLRELPVTCYSDHWEELSSVIVTALISRVQLRNWQLPSYDMVVERGKTDEDALWISSAWRD
jgi:hypothetical protein